MSDAAVTTARPRGRTQDAAPKTAANKPAPAQGAGAGADAAASTAEGQSRINQLRVSGHLMTLESGLFCLFHSHEPVTDQSGLPGIRVSLPPGAPSNNVSIATFSPDGWVAGGNDAAIVRVTHGPAQVLVTVYQSPNHGAEQAPRMQVVRISGDAQPPAPAAAQAPTGTPEMVAHIQRSGDVPGTIGEWLGVRGSQRWIEGFGLAPRTMISPEEIEYQAVLGRGWLSPWVEGGKFCGSRGMALPLLGIRMRLKGDAARRFDLTYAATFVDGTAIGPVPAEEPCEAESLAALEAFVVTLAPRAGGQAAPKPSATAKPSTAKPAPARAPAAPAKPAAPRGKAAPAPSRRGR
jgi:hypothetical protein